MNNKKDIGYYYRELKDLSFLEIIIILYMVFMPSFLLIILIKMIILVYKIHITDLRWIEVMGQN